MPQTHFDISDICIYCIGYCSADNHTYVSMYNYIYVLYRSCYIISLKKRSSRHQVGDEEAAASVAARLEDGDGEVG